MSLHVVMSEDRPFPLGGANMGMELELEALHIPTDACQISKKRGTPEGEEGTLQGGLEMTQRVNWRLQ